jgi:RNA polymerase sigma-70 factor (ECF subfamily)
MQQSMDKGSLARFEAEVLPHVNAAYTLARWLTRSQTDAEDVVQEAYLRALRFFDGYRGPDGRTWFLAIVRNTAHTWLRQNRIGEPARIDDQQEQWLASDGADPSALMQSKLDAQAVRDAIEALPVEFREVLVMREMEALSYKEIASVAELPIGTVMSRLSRARQMLQRKLQAAVCEGGNA